MPRERREQRGRAGFFIPAPASNDGKRPALLTPGSLRPANGMTRCVDQSLVGVGWELVADGVDPGWIVVDTEVGAGPAGSVEERADLVHEPVERLVVLGTATVDLIVVVPGPAPVGLRRDQQHLDHHRLAEGTEPTANPLRALDVGEQPAERRREQEKRQGELRRHVPADGRGVQRRARCGLVEHACSGLSDIKNNCLWRAH